MVYVRLSYEMLHKLLVLLVCLIPVTIQKPVLVDIHIIPIQVCMTSVYIRILIAGYPNEDRIPQCFITYRTYEGIETVIQNKTFAAEDSFSLTNLNIDTQYELYVTCFQNASSNILAFKTAQCPTGPPYFDEAAFGPAGYNSTGLRSPDEQPPVMYEDHSVFSRNTIDVILGILLGFAGTVVIIITFYYIWRKYRRRRRMRRYYRSVSTDPFQSLQLRVDGNNSLLLYSQESFT